MDETRDWLRRLVERLEADLAKERAEAEREKRRVVVEDGEDGMSWFMAYLPSHLAAAQYDRLRRRARALKAAGDDRTIDQIMADLVADATIADDATGDGSGLRIDIGVLLTPEALTGADDSFAESADGTWEVPADWVLQAAAVGDTFWHRLLTDPPGENVLAIEHRGYTPPDLLRRALVLRDGTCATPGCLKPAIECDLDHVMPWPHGPTQGTNLRHRCRRHHILKSHGCLPAPDRGPREPH